MLANWTSGNNALRARMGHGFMYTYISKSGSANLLIQQNGQAEVDDNVLYLTINGNHYAVYAPTGSTWNGSGSQFTSALNGLDYCSIALLPDNSSQTKAAFKANAFAFITKTTSSYDISPTDGMVNTHFNFTFDNKEGSASKTFTALYRHQWLYCDEVNTGYTFNSPRGEMKVLEGDGFTTSMPTVGSFPLMPKGSEMDDQTLANLVKQFADRPVYNCQGQGCQQSYYGNYTFGRFMIQAGQVALIADQIGDTQSRDKIVNWLKTELENFFNYSDGNNHYIGYNDTWDITLINGDYIEHCSIDCLNDRNLQYGYWVRAAAIVEQFNPGWTDDWGEMVELLIRCVSNTNRSDEMFPFMRNFDVYAGHSWALGFSDMQEGADQESSSESLNFASALIYYGQVTGRQDLIDRGVYMYSTEVVATEQYWLDVDEAVFPETFYPEMVGLVRSSGSFYQLWWELQPEHVLMVNSFPWTGGALYLGRHPMEAERIFNWIETGADKNGITKWWGYLWPYMAFFDPDRAINEYNTISYDYTIELEAQANNYYWLYTLAEIGEVAGQISANHPSAVAFDKDGVYTYGIWNPDATAKVVTFSDGLSFEAPAGSLAYYKADDAIIDPCEIPDHPDCVITTILTRVAYEPKYTWKNNELLLHENFKQVLIYNVLGVQIAQYEGLQEHETIRLNKYPVGTYIITTLGSDLKKSHSKIQITQ